MRNRRKTAILLVVQVLAALLSGCSGRQEENRLLGEAHSNEQFTGRSLEIWPVSLVFQDKGLQAF